jgi:acyl transferase domain-containing protein
MTIDDGIKLVATRGRLTQSLDPIGAMAVLFATEEWVNAAIAGHENDMSIAAINAPEVIVVSGHNEHIVELLRVAETHKVSGKMLKISHAFHSPCIEPMLTELEEAAAKIPLNEPTVRFASTLEGRLLDPGEVPDASYWRRHAREPVRFLSTMRELKRAGCNVFLELGPHATLTGLGERCVSPEVAQWLPSLRRKGRDWQVIVETAIKLWLAGVELNLAGMAKSLGWEWVGSRDGSVQRRAEGRKRK